MATSSLQNSSTEASSIRSLRGIINSQVISLSRIYLELKSVLFGLATTPKTLKSRSLQKKLLQDTLVVVGVSRWNTRTRHPTLLVQQSEDRRDTGCQRGKHNSSSFAKSTRGIFGKLLCIFFFKQTSERS